MSNSRARAVVASAAAVAMLASAAVADAGHRAHAAGAAPCKARNTQVWLGDGEGGGTAGHYYYPIEFSNVGHSSCTLYGFPGVSALGSGGHRVGQPGARINGPHSTVTLAPRGTAHAILAIADAGAICSAPVSADAVSVYPPGQRAAKQFEFQFQACPSASVLSVEPVRAGVGIPGYTNS
jgi:Domain of unknown function (DUF4232)